MFDVAGKFAGCIPGLHYVLMKQGLMKGTWCLNPNEVLSEGQAEEIDRLWAAYPEVADDDFVKSFLSGLPRKEYFNESFISRCRWLR